jgi:hypothetical protein
MAFNPFIGWSQEDLLEALTAAQEDLAAGKSTTRVGAGDANVESRMDKSPEARIELLYRALNLLDSTRYPIDQISRISITKAAFSSS